MCISIVFIFNIFKVLGDGAPAVHYPGCGTQSVIPVCPDNPIHIFTYLQTTTLLNTESIGIPTTPQRIYLESVHQSGEILDATADQCFGSSANSIAIGSGCAWVSYLYVFIIGTETTIVSLCSELKIHFIIIISF